MKPFNSSLAALEGAPAHEIQPNTWMGAALIFVATHGIGLISAGMNVDDWVHLAGQTGWIPIGRYGMEVIHRYAFGLSFVTGLQIAGAFLCLMASAWMLVPRRRTGSTAAMLLVFAGGTSFPYFVDALNFSAHVFGYPLSLAFGLAAFRFAGRWKTLLPCAVAFPAFSASIYQSFALFGSFAVAMRLIDVSRRPRLALPSSLCSRFHPRLRALQGGRLSRPCVVRLRHRSTVQAPANVGPDHQHDRRAGGGLPRLVRPLSLHSGEAGGGPGLRRGRRGSFGPCERCRVCPPRPSLGGPAYRPWRRDPAAPVVTPGILVAGVPPSRALAPLGFALPALALALPHIWTRRFVIGLALGTIMPTMILTAAMWADQAEAARRDRALASSMAGLFASLPQGVQPGLREPEPMTSSGGAILWACPPSKSIGAGSSSSGTRSARAFPVGSAHPPRATPPIRSQDRPKTAKASSSAWTRPRSASPKWTPARTSTAATGSTSAPCRTARSSAPIAAAHATGTSRSSASRPGNPQLIADYLWPLKGARWRGQCYWAVSTEKELLLRVQVGKVRRQAKQTVRWHEDIVVGK